MKKLLLSLALIIGFMSMGFAQGGDKSQNREESKNRIEASKVAYMTTYLELSAEEAAEFWPVYNQYQSELKALRGERGERKKISEMTEAEAAAKLDKHIAMSSKKADLHAQYTTRFRNILSDKKVLMLNKAEGDFKKQMVKRYADRRGNRGEGKKPDGQKSRNK